MNVNYFFVMIAALILVGSSVQYGIVANAEPHNNMTQNQQMPTKMTMQKLNFEEMAKDPEFVKKIIEYMKKNHSFTQDVMTSMIKDPMLRLQMIGHMTENKDAMKQMTDMMGQDATKLGKMMKGSTMDNSMMSGDSKMDKMKMAPSDMSMKKEPATQGTSSKVDFSDIKVTNVSSNGVTIEGTTNKDVKCQVEYWTSKDQKHYFASDGNMMDMPHSNHKVTIKDLTSNTKYQYKFKATVGGQTFYSKTDTFTTIKGT